MTDKELVKLLSKVKDAPELGGDFTKEQQQASWLKICDSLGWEAKDQKANNFSIFAYLQFAGHQLSRTVMQPAAVMVAAFVLVLGGWTATVNASHALPGDMLYPVKLATERVRITMASSSQARAQLHVEFAGRRLSEISQIKDGALVQMAVSDFNNQMAHVSQELADVQNQDPDAALALAVLVGEKADEYEATLAGSRQDGQDSDEDMASAWEAVNATDNAARETVVASHEETGASFSADVLQQNFQKEYRSLMSRITFSLGRLSVIEIALEENSLSVAPYSDRLLSVQETIREAEKMLRLAMDTLAMGGFRTAFTTLDEIDAKLKQVENLIAEIEIEMTAPPEPPEPPELANPVNNSFEEVVVPESF